MTGQEMERAIEFLLESHAGLTVKIDRLTENQDRLEASVGVLAESVGTLAQEAAADRTEIRAAVNTMLSFAESMAGDVKLLALVQETTAKRVANLETRVDSLEDSGA